MLKKTITFEDLDGNEVTEDFYFHLSKAELVEWQLGKEGGMEEYLRKILETKNTTLLISTFKDILLKSYGVRSEDNRSFVKSETFTQKFQGTEAYSQIFMELVTDAKAGVEFINGIMPKDVAEKVRESQKSGEVMTLESAVLNAPKDISEMSRDELIAAYQKAQSTQRPKVIG